MPASTDLPELVSLQVSPWSLKARWALKHHSIQYRTTPHAPVIGDYKLRWRLWKWTGKVTVPILFVKGQAPITDSTDIARWADSHSCRSGAEPLFPGGQVEEVRRWVTLSDDVLFYGRRQLAELALVDPAVRARYLPRFIRRLGPLTDWVALWGARRFAAKYARESGGSSKEKALAALEELRSALQRSKFSYILGDKFSYADIVMAAALQMVLPVGPPYSASLAGRPVQLVELEKQFGELLPWRDRVFKQHWPLEGKQGAGAGSQQGQRQQAAGQREKAT
mmetsp:Transcript_36218/g.80591  ORF Transcript_36218/g.80591 Transcript_36218/m.80591 type:complete len:280 (-) Transcript_36218:391-1230(-)|eukprot:CAMPEP_0202903008 /NCGR_PEP_ID=MMETSP1392-20130828/20354_1 /ASSEMBLY_ACC=CAM_ASM_000868 /TAXON_ID=225041 /ORGANISM="Chlamydomonas chlamydogama, Strain SAG 11-48b" /LENGTH=279 /DNA_ID=CAMNT_0049589959 /DNA_START=46 /DNA_END=885 /DNA_ORIENTATION=-